MVQRTFRIVHIPSWSSVRKFTKLAARQALHGRGVAMSRTDEELRQQWLRKAHVNNAKPVSGHHPMNMIIRRAAMRCPDIRGEIG
ncbi:hypothetical protein RRH01S_02_04610 [Rhizobium rhizogenes NBRC 13257]|uniref:Uncharacterized protein n=1 Tax=Rhizobium rhizogenes NBRC 13257 TaxID=1220581 RepID=A0AA87Q9G3_RHIRH|nr:hypothetical protein RRH01S_02_04610 [Rhizobium rhizogenes NBRC 13257]